MQQAAAALGLPDPDDETTIRALIAEPAYAAATRHLLQRFLAIHDGWLVRKMFADESRFFISIYAIWLHATFDPAEPGSGLTLSRLVQQCTALGIMAHGRVEAQVSVLRRSGRLVDAPTGPDRRIRRLVPSPQLEAEFRERLRLHLETLEMLRPGRGYMHCLDTDPEFFWAFQRQRGAMLRAAPDPRVRSPKLAAMAEIDGGFIVMAALILALESPLTPAEVAFPLTEQAARLSLPRTQLARVLERLEEAGLIENRPGRVRMVHVLPDAVRTMATFQAVRLLRHDVFCAGAMAERAGVG